MIIINLHQPSTIVLETPRSIETRRRVVQISHGTAQQQDTALQSNAQRPLPRHIREIWKLDQRFQQDLVRIHLYIHICIYIYMSINTYTIPYHTIPYYTIQYNTIYIYIYTCIYSDVCTEKNHATLAVAFAFLRSAVPPPVTALQGITSSWPLPQSPAVESDDPWWSMMIHDDPWNGSWNSMNLRCITTKAPKGARRAPKRALLRLFSSTFRARKRTWQSFMAASGRGKPGQNCGQTKHLNVVETMINHPFGSIWGIVYSTYLWWWLGDDLLLWYCFGHIAYDLSQYGEWNFLSR